MGLFDVAFLQSQVFWTGAAFFVLLAVIYWKVVPNVTDALDGRANKIREDLDRAAALRNEAESMLQTYEKQLKVAREEASEIVSKARQEAEDIVASRTKEVEAELNRKAEDARKSIEQAKEDALYNLRQEVVEITLMATEKLVGSEMDKKKAATFADEAIKELKH